MSNIVTIFKKEFSFYLNSPIGYIPIVLFSIVANFLFVKDLFLRGDSSLRPFFDLVPWLFLLFLPALAMRSVAEEHNTNTIEVLLALPVSESQIVIAKWLALCVVIIISLLLTISLPVTLAAISTIAVGEIAVSYVGAILLAAAALSLCLFFSSQTKSQLIAFLFSAISLFLLFVIGGSFFESVIPRVIAEYTSILSPIYHYELFLKGIVDIRAVVYMVSFIMLFLFLTVITLEKRT